MIPVPATQRAAVSQQIVETQALMRSYKAQIFHYFV